MAARPERAASLGALRARLDEVTIADARRLRRRIDAARREGDPGRRAAAEARLDAAVAEAERRLERRRLAVPDIRYPEELPVSQRRDEIAAAIRDHQVVIVAGETGSGKTTQLPKICLELGRGVRGVIGHTQPRRLAARTVAERIAAELGTELGGAVGYAVRFTDRVGDDTLVKLMTDGILLTDIHRDRSLSAYDTVIVDEAHERSLNIDFILGYLHQLLPRRPDLKVVVTSATIDPARFSRHFGDAPVIEVSGRTYPVEVRYRPLGGDARRDQVQAIVDAVDELRTEPPGDVLVFLSGEREIRDAAEALRGATGADTEILPLYARLSAAEQHRVFTPHAGRRIVLATNVAETSLTVPGVRYVVDPGTARMSRYSHRLKVQRLPIEAVSQASADQRAGRCGRVAAGVCIRLYDEDDYAARPAFTEPEILRTSLASVILQMAALDLGDVAAFPFLDPPDRRAVADGVRLLQELGALEVAPARDPRDDRKVPPPRLTDIGRRLARLPVDPRFGRMVLEADRLGCLREVLIIAAALSIEDPRERPGARAAGSGDAEQRTAADQFHARFHESGSEFIAYLDLWRYLRERQRELSGNQFRRLCRTEFLNFLRVREWQDVHSQLRRIAGELGMKQGTGPAEPDAVHRALLSGLLSHIGVREGQGDRDKRESREFRGPRNARFAIFPGSPLARKPPAWVMAAELVETSRLWARTVARIQPEWAEELAPHLVSRSYSKPHWSASRGSAMAYETVTLYGLPIVTRRLVPYARVDPGHARELFIRHALVEGDWVSHHAFLRHNRELLGELAEIEHRFRRNDLVAGDDALERLYDERVDETVVSARHFDSWWKRTRRDRPDLLTFTADMLLTDAAADLDDAGFPDEWHQGALTLPLTYAFHPGETDDGVTVHLPLAALNQLRSDDFDWQVPGLRVERVAALIRSLPKALRRNLLPIPETARAVLAEVPPCDGPLLDVLARELSRRAGARIGADAFDLSRVPPHLSVTFLVGDDEGNALGEGKDLDVLRRRLAGDVQAAIARSSAGLERGGLRSWDFGELPRRHADESVGAVGVVGYPALVDEGESVAIRIFADPAAQHEAMWGGIRRLLLLRIPVSGRVLRDRLTRRAGLALAASPYAGADALAQDCLTAALDSLLAEHGAPVWDAVGFDALRVAVRAGLDERVAEVVTAVAAILVVVADIDRRLAEPVPPALAPAHDDIAGQRASLVAPGFVAAAGAERLGAIERYLRAIVHRLDSLPGAPARDRDRMAQVRRVEAAYAAAIDAAPADGRADAELERVGWMIEELRVSLFAQRLGTPEPVSEKRIRRALEGMAR
jgi:ATP-dependent helicase HrpA